MVESRRNLWVAAGLIALLAVGAAALPSTGWTCGLTVVLGLAGVVLLRGNGWRSGALLIAAVAVAIGLLDLFAGLIAPQAHGVGLVKRFEPLDWIVPDKDLGYRPRPDTAVVATETWDAETVFHVTYTITADGTRATPKAPEGADIYLFMGDSFMFGQGLSDDETLPAQFAREADFKIRAVNFAVPGYAPNQLVRALEIGRLDTLKGQPVKAVMTWIIPAHLARVTGDEPWLGASPRYVLEAGRPPRYTGSFDRHRWSDPIDGLHHLANQQFPFVAAIGERQRQEHQAAVFTALVLRLQQLVREKFGAPLMVLYSWPDETAPPGFDPTYMAQPMLVSILKGLQSKGVPLMSVNKPTEGIDTSKLVLPHDGHPSALSDRVLAVSLKKRLIGP